MKHIVPFILALLAIASGAQSAAVRFEGDRPHNAATVERLARQGSSPDSLVALLSAEGYIDADVTQHADTTLIDAGARATLDTLHVIENDTTTYVLHIPFAAKTVDSLITSILERKYAHGYLYATVDVDGMSRNRERVVLSLKLNPGPSMILRRLDLRGLVRTLPAFIERYLPIAPGDTLTPLAVAAVERAAERIDFVHYIPPAKIRPQAGYTSADLSLDFEEQRPLTIEAGGGYIPADTGSQVVWHLNLRFNNLLGGGRQARILSERREEGRQLLQIGYSQPVFLFGSGRLDGEVATRDYRDSFYEFGARSGLSTQIGEQFSGGMELGFRRVEPADEEPPYSAYRAAFLSGWDGLDRRFNPTSGIRFQSSIAYVNRRYDTDSLATGPGRAVFNETRADAALAMYQPLFSRLVGHVELKYRGLETSQPLPPLSELIFVGGPGTLRGYRNEQFAVLRTALVTVEPHWQFDSGYLFAFYDGAYLNNRVPAADGGVRTDERYRSGYGIGLGLADGRRSVRLSLGWNPDLSYDQPRLSIELSSDI